MMVDKSLPNGTYTYTYDSRSNRLTTRFVNTALTQDETTSYAYSIDDRMLGYAVFDNILQTTIRYAEYTYDNAGNTTQRVITENGIPSTTSYTYYDDNRIHTVTLPSSELITFTYFADGSRATKESSTEWITYHYATGLVKEVHHLASDHNTTTFTLHYEPGRIIYEPYGGTPTTYYTVTDTQGTIYKLLDTQGTTVANYTYDPFGNRLTNTAPTIYNPIGFAGTYLDTESGLYFAQSRYLDPTTSRFTTKDSYRGDLQSHISQNRYIYCCNNPATLIDPSGLSPQTWGGGIDKDDFLWASTDGKFRTFMQNWDLVMACFDYDQWKIDHPGENLGPRAYVFPRKDGKGYVLCVLPEPVYHLPIEPGSINRPSASALEKYNKEKFSFSKLSTEEKDALLTKIGEVEAGREPGKTTGTKGSFSVNLTDGTVTITTKDGGTKLIDGSNISRASWGIDSSGNIWVQNLQLSEASCPWIFWGPDAANDEAHNEAGIGPGKLFTNGNYECWWLSWEKCAEKNGGGGFYCFDTKSTEGSTITIRFQDIFNISDPTKDSASLGYIKIPGGYGKVDISYKLIPLSTIPESTNEKTSLLPSEGLVSFMM